MWARFKRIIRSFVGFFIELGEDPELILKQNLRDMEDQLPEINRNLAYVRSTVNLLEKEIAKLKAQEAELAAKIKAALKVGKRDIALNFATTLEVVRKDMASSKGQLETSKLAYEKALRVKRQFLNNLQQKSREVASALSAKRRAAWQAKVADAMEGFKVAGIDASHDEMITRIEQQASLDEAKMEVALDNVDAQQFDIEMEARKIQANSTLAEFEAELGLVGDGVASAADAVPESEGAADIVKSLEAEVVDG